MTATTSRTRRIAIALVVAALTATGLVVSAAGPATATSSGMLSQVNASRSAQGLGAYAWNDHLAAVASEQAQRMADKRVLYHNPNLASDVGSFRWVGENVGYGPSSDSIERAFMNSAPHRHNILDHDYTQVGIAQVRDSKGRLWVAQVFREPVGGGSSTPTVHKTSKPKAKASTHHVTTRTTVRTHRANATVHPTPAPKPVSRVVAAPQPQPTLAQRVSYATSRAPSTNSDPLADALAFAATMNAVAG